MSDGCKIIQSFFSISFFLLRSFIYQFIIKAKFQNHIIKYINNSTRQNHSFSLNKNNKGNFINFIKVFDK